VLQFWWINLISWADALAPSVCGLFKWRQFEPEVILLAVGWYLRFFTFVPRRGGVARRAGFKEERCGEN